MENETKNTDIVVVPETTFNIIKAPSSYDIVKRPEFNKQYAVLINTLDYLQTLKKELDTQLKTVLAEEYFNSGEQTVDLQDCKITFVPDSMKESFDTKKFKEENPELYIQYTKISPVSASVRTTMKKK